VTTRGAVFASRVGRPGGFRSIVRHSSTPSLFFSMAIAEVLSLVVIRTCFCGFVAVNSYSLRYRADATATRKFCWETGVS
jgi:hypothetical protein